MPKIQAQVKFEGFLESFEEEYGYSITNDLLEKYRDRYNCREKEKNIKEALSKIKNAESLTELFQLNMYKSKNDDICITEYKVEFTPEVEFYYYEEYHRLSDSSDDDELFMRFGLEKTQSYHFLFQKGEEEFTYRDEETLQSILAFLRALKLPNISVATVIEVLSCIVGDLSSYHSLSVEDLHIRRAVIDTTKQITLDRYIEKWRQDVKNTINDNHEAMMITQ